MTSETAEIVMLSDPFITVNVEEYDFDEKELCKVRKLLHKVNNRFMSSHLLSERKHGDIINYHRAKYIRQIVRQHLFNHKKHMRILRTIIETSQLFKEEPGSKPDYPKEWRELAVYNAVVRGIRRSARHPFSISLKHLSCKKPIRLRDQAALGISNTHTKCDIDFWKTFGHDDTLGCILFYHILLGIISQFQSNQLSILETIFQSEELFRFIEIMQDDQRFNGWYLQSLVDQRELYLQYGMGYIEHGFNRRSLIRSGLCNAQSSVLPHPEEPPTRSLQ